MSNEEKQRQALDLLLPLSDEADDLLLPPYLHDGYETVTDEAELVPQAEAALRDLVPEDDQRRRFRMLAGAVASEPGHCDWTILLHRVRKRSCARGEWGERTLETLPWRNIATTPTSLHPGRPFFRPRSDWAWKSRPCRRKRLPSPSSRSTGASLRALQPSWSRDER